MKFLIKKVIKGLLQSRSDPLITITISRSALLHNLKAFQDLNPENMIVPVLKSNAYSHGLIEVATILKDKVNLFVIDSYFEAETLRNAGIKNPLLVIGYVRPETIQRSKLKNISFTITSIDTLFSINSKTRIHLKIDTGMNRQGILPSEIETAFKFIKNSPNIILEGVCSHLADADNTNPDFTRKQISLWNSIVEKTKKEFPNIKYIHLSNTFGHKFSKEIKANTSRLGIGLYGLADIENLNLKPVLEMHTIITSIKNVKKGAFIGYNNTFNAANDMTIATIPVGYFEGLDRSLSNKGFVEINNKFCPIIGRISMNITTIDVSNINNIKVGDKVKVISSTSSDKNSIRNMTEFSKTITYELVVRIPAHLKRIVID